MAQCISLLSIIIFSLSLFGCSDSLSDYPVLLPTDSLLAEPAIPGHAQIAASSPDQVKADLEAAGQALAVGSTEITAQNVANKDELNARAEELRRRARALQSAE